MKTLLHPVTLEIIIVMSFYELLLRNLNGTNIVAGVFSPGPHLPHHYPLLIGLLICCRLYIVLWPGIVLGRVGNMWLKNRHDNARAG